MLRSSTIRCSMRGRRRGLCQEGEDNELEARHDAPSVDVHEEAGDQEDTA